MSNEAKKCGCGNHGEEKLEDGCNCGHDHDHEDEGCGCGCGEEEDALVIDLEDADGNIITCPVVDEFQFEEKNYVLAKSPEDDSVYMFRVEGEEGQELIVPEEEEFDRVAEYYNNELVEE